MVGFVEDITERSRMEEALREGQATLRTFYDIAPLAMGVVEIHGDDLFLVSANQATADLIGVPGCLCKVDTPARWACRSNCGRTGSNATARADAWGGRSGSNRLRMAWGTAMARLGRLPDQRGLGGSGTIRLRHRGDHRAKAGGGDPGP